MGLECFDALTTLKAHKNDIGHAFPDCPFAQWQDAGLAPMARFRTTSLSDFRAAYNGITDLTPLRGHPIQYLYLYQNDIENLEGLEELPLETVKLYYNDIEDLTPLVANVNLESGDFVDLRYNNLNCVDADQHASWPVQQCNILNLHHHVGGSKPYYTCADDNSYSNNFTRLGEKLFFVDGWDETNERYQNLEYHVRYKFNELDGDPVTFADTESATSFTANHSDVYVYKDVTNLVGLQCFTEIQTTTIKGHHEDLDLAPMAGLRELGQTGYGIDLTNNDISDLHWLSFLPNLERLVLHGNDMDTAELVELGERFPALEKLNLDDNGFDSIAAWAGNVPNGPDLGEVRLYDNPDFEETADNKDDMRDVCLNKSHVYADWGYCTWGVNLPHCSCSWDP